MLLYTFKELALICEDNILWQTIRESHACKRNCDNATTDKIDCENQLIIIMGLKYW